MALLKGEGRSLHGRLLALLLATFLVLSIVLYSFSPGVTHAATQWFTAASSDRRPREKTYSFGNVTAANDLVDGLTTAECHALFPDLYQERDRAVAYWTQRNHTITPEDVQIDAGRRGAMRVLIHDNTLRIVESRDGYIVAFRAAGQLYMLQRALEAATAAGERLPTVELVLNFFDDALPSVEGTSTMWTTARHVAKEAHRRLWLMPNFDFWWSAASGAFEDAKRLAMQYDAVPWADKIPRIVWRGNVAMNPELRGALLEATAGQAWADVLSVTGPADDDANKLEEFQYCRYAMTLYTEGVTFSGRLKFLLNCRSVLFVPEAEWTVHYDHLLVDAGPGQNHIAVRRDWSDLEEKVQWCLAHPAEAQRIADNALATFRSRYTTRAATSCYLRELLRGYASVAFAPDVDHPIYGGEVRVPRGINFAEYIIWPRDGLFDRVDHVGFQPPRKT